MRLTAHTPHARAEITWHGRKQQCVHEHMVTNARLAVAERRPTPGAVGMLKRIQNHSNRRMRVALMYTCSTSHAMHTDTMHSTGEAGGVRDGMHAFTLRNARQRAHCARRKLAALRNSTRLAACSAACMVPTARRARGGRAGCTTQSHHRQQMRVVRQKRRTFIGCPAPTNGL